MARKQESLILLLFHSRWWMSIVVSLLFFILLKFVWPLMLSGGNQFLQGLAQAGPQYAPYAFLLLIITPFAYFNTLRKRKLLDKQKSLATVRSLTWKEFEELVAEGYRRKGYSVVENYDTGPDGGVDLVLKKGSSKYIVQCKQWKQSKIDVRTVREMYGVMNAENADKVVIVTSGVFTRDAGEFAKDKPIELVDGLRLLELIGIKQINKVVSSENAGNYQPDMNICPECGEQLVIRKARKGQNAGKEFWGCSGFPKCRFTREYVN